MHPPSPHRIPQTSQWFFSTYREGALPAFLQGVSRIKATILEKTKLDAIETAPDLFSLSFSPCLRRGKGVYIFLTMLFQAVCQIRLQFVFPGPFPPLANTACSTTQWTSPVQCKTQVRGAGGLGGGVSVIARSEWKRWLSTASSGILHTTPTPAAAEAGIWHTTPTPAGLQRLHTEQWNFTRKLWPLRSCFSPAGWKDTEETKHTRQSY